VDSIRKGYRRSVCLSDRLYFRIENTVEIMSIMGGQEWDEKIFQEGQKGLAANKKKPDISAWLVVAGTGLTNTTDYQ